MALEEKPKATILGGSIFLKIIILIAVGILVFVVLFGVPTSVFQFFWDIVAILFAVGLIFLVIKGIASFFPRKRFSPTRSFLEKAKGLAIDSKPFNLKKLGIRGEDMRVYSYYGKIKGALFIPYLAGEEIINKFGKYVYEQKKNKAGDIIKNKDKKPVLINKRKLLNEKDGDWLFVVNTGFLGLFGKDKMVRAHKSLVSDLGETTWIKCVNLLPIGSYFYPNQQWQKDIKRIKVQHQSEAILETYEEFLDLVANITEMTLSADPNFQKQLRAKSEELASEQAGTLVKNG